MSELREELLAGGINKKRIIALVLVASILISLFAFSVFVVSMVFGTQREPPSKENAETPSEYPILVEPPLPLDFLEKLKDYFMNNPEALEQLLNMFDGDIDDFDLNEYSQALLLLGALAGGIYAEMEVFRFSNSTDILYTDINTEKLSDVLWKMECFNEFTGDEWQSTANKGVYDFYPEDDYHSKYSHLDLFRIKMSLSPTLGTANSMVLPALFPIPFILDTLYAPYLDFESESTNLYKDDFNCTTVDLDFTSEESVNLTYETFGLNLPSNNEINNSAIHSSYTPNIIKDLYLQLPPSINGYISSHPLFKYHYDILDTIIDDNDNAFEVANKIRNYLQSNFFVGYDALINDPQEDEEDVVEWFLEHEEGLWAEWASAFCAFTRAFNVSSRFVDGFRNDFLGEVDQIYDEGRDAVIIKNKHLYNWAEIYVPTDVSGNGYWVQMDVIFDNFGGGPIQPPIHSFNIDITSNSSAGYRDQMVNLTATLSSPTGGVVANKTVSFYDHTSEIGLGSALTDQNGNASILVKIDDSQVVGPHIISASFQSTINFTYYVIYGDIEVNLVSVNPQLINRSVSNTTRIQGYVNDPIANQRVSNATVELLLLQKGTNNRIINPFDLTYIDTDINGDFDVFVNLNPSVMKGNYDVRVDFNGSWWGGFPLAPFIMNDSSNRMDLNVTEESVFRILFSINGTPSNYPFALNPSNIINVTQGSQLNLSVTLIEQETMVPAPGVIIEFYDYTNGDILIDTDVTDSFGNASILYNIGSGNKAGPSLVYARVGNIINYSYYIVNQSIWINIISYSNPLEIDLAGNGPTQFNIQCSLFDINGNPIIDSKLNLRMNRSLTDYTNYLTPGNPISPISLGSNIFDFNRGVITSTPVNNYSLRLEFDGDFNFSSYPYPATFNLDYLYNSIEISTQLRVFDSNDVIIYLAVEGNSTVPLYDNLYRPEIYSRGQVAIFDVTVLHMGIFPAIGTYVTIWDDYSNLLLDNYTYPGGTGDVQFNISTNRFYYAGIHKIRVQFMDYPTFNTTFIIINESVSIDFVPSVTNIVRNNGGFVVTGYVRENGTGLRGLHVSLQLLNISNGNNSQFLIGSLFDFTTNNGFFQFDVNYIDIACPHGIYYLRIDFNGSIYLPGIPGIDLIPHYMVNSSSYLLQLNISAGTIINEGYYAKYGEGYHSKLQDIYPLHWVDTDILYVYGELTWDNGTLFSGVNITVTVQLLNGTIIASNSSVQTLNGQFNSSLVVDNKWPTLRSETMIVVYFNPLIQNPFIPFVEGSNNNFT